jgi:hypothetical protein
MEYCRSINDSISYQYFWEKWFISWILKSLFNISAYHCHYGDTQNYRIIYYALHKKGYRQNER